MTTTTQQSEEDRTGVVIEGMPTLGGRLLLAGDLPEVSVQALDQWKALAQQIRGPFSIIARSTNVSPDISVAVTDINGSRPIYLNESGTRVAMGGSLKSVTTGGSLPLRSQAVVRYLAFGNCGGACSFVDRVRTVPGASVCVCDGTETKTEGWFDWAKTVRSDRTPVEDLEKEFEAIMTSWAEIHLPRSGRIALLLSGGTDSGLLAAMLKPLLGDRLVCITQDFLLKRYSERADATETARRIGTSVQVAPITRGDYHRAFIELNSGSQDMPVYLTEAHTLYCLSKFAMDQGMETIIHGWNADFLFLGQGQFFTGFPPDTGKYLEAISRLEPEEKLKWVLPRPASPTRMSTELLAALGISDATYNHWVQEFIEYRRPALERVAYLDLPKLQQVSCQFDFGVSWQLEPGAVMRALPGCRLLAPFVDSDMIRFGLRMPPDLLFRDGQSKYFLRRLFQARTGLLRVKRPASLSPLRYWRFVPSPKEYARLKPNLRGVYRGFLSRNLTKLGALYTPLTKIAALGLWMESHHVSPAKEPE